MTIKQQGGIFGRNPTFNDVDVDGDLSVAGSFSSTGEFSVAGTITVDGIVLDQTTNTISTGTSDGSDTARLFLNGGGSPSVNRGGNISVYGNEYSSIGGNVIIAAGDALTGGAVDGDIRFLTGPSRKRITVDENGDVFFYDSVGSTPKMTYDASAGNLLFTSGNGIDFSATSGTGTSELFDDYEEGGYTPALGSGVSTTSSTGLYTKIGNRCFFTADFTVGTTSNTGASYISLPFATTASAASAAGGQINWTDYGAATYSYILESSNRFYFRSATGGALTYANISGKRFRISGNFEVA